MSRMAIHSRPTAPRTRFLARSAITANITRQNQYLATGLSSESPNPCRLLTDTEPDDELLVNHCTRKKSQSAKNCAASVATARYKPLTRKLGRPKSMPNNMAQTPPKTNATIKGMPSIRTKKLYAA